MFIRKMLFHIARSRPMGCLIGAAARYCPFVFPVQKICQDRQIMAFHHPAPSYDCHALFLPRKYIRSILQLKDAELFSKLVGAAEAVSRAPEWAGRTLLFCVNAGTRQDVGQLHFHLVSIRDASGYDVHGPVLRETNGCLLAGSEKRLAVSAGKDAPWQTLFSAAMDVLNDAAQDMDLTQEGFSLRLLKRPDQNAFEKRIYLDFDRLITERRKQ